MRRVTVTQFRKNPERIARNAGGMPVAVCNSGGVSFYAVEAKAYDSQLNAFVDLIRYLPASLRCPVAPAISLSAFKALPELPKKAQSALIGKMGMGALARASKTLCRDELVIEVVINNFRFSFRETAFDSFRALPSEDQRLMREALINWDRARGYTFTFGEPSGWHLCMGRQDKVAAVIDCQDVNSPMVIAAVSEINEGLFNADSFVTLP